MGPRERFADVNVSVCHLVLAVSWTFRSMIELFFMSLMIPNLNGNRYLQGVIQPFAIPALQRITAAMFQDDNA